MNTISTTILFDRIVIELNTLYDEVELLEGSLQYQNTPLRLRAFKDRIKCIQSDTNAVRTNYVDAIGKKCKLFGGRERGCGASACTKEGE